ncbi:CBS domain-containing protein [uncultured Pseudoteredinibacter sp.]|uniref:CBS domain-containing protein n=1 Tax=uncultured Pseudoteredinibacter sp. TaxID=1641701 RepID=UPI002612FA24|nr:CBS domain-containing protein [uncultured Pseudoteredinibacter sp.]
MELAVKSLTIADFMDHDPHAIPHTANIREAVDSLLTAGVLGAPVVDEQQNVVGFVSEHDCMKDMLNGSFYHEAPDKVTSVMFNDPVTVDPHSSIIELAEAMMSNKPKNYPVVRDGKLVGLISRKHVLQALLEND